MGDQKGVLAGVEASAISVLKDAVELDTAQRFTEALACYRQGIQLLLDCLKAISNEEKKQGFRQKIEQYMGRAEKLKQHLEQEKQAGKYHEQYRFESNSTGHSYETTFGRFFDDSVTLVEVEDPYIRSVHQVYNFLRFCEMVVRKCKNVRNISLLTGLEEDQGARVQQQKRLEDLANSLRDHQIILKLQFSQTLHDREIRLDSGWIIKIGRGLDYFKAASSKFAIGYCDMDLRPCHETTVDVFHRKHTKDTKD